MHERLDDHVDEDEQKLAEVRKHPFGIIALYLQASIGMILAVGLSYMLLPSLIEDGDTAFLIGNSFALVAVALTFLIVLVATIVYRQNRLIITDRNITQILQYGLFNRKISQLNMHNVEDVTSIQSGIIPTILNYGTLKIETAGEQANFIFVYCPDSDYYAKIILDARERMLGQVDEEDRPLHQQAGNHKKESAKQHLQALKDIGAEVVEQAIISDRKQ